MKFDVPIDTEHELPAVFETLVVPELPEESVPTSSLLCYIATSLSTLERPAVPEVHNLNCRHHSPSWYAGFTN